MMFLKKIVPAALLLILVIAVCTVMYQVLFLPYFGLSNKYNQPADAEITNYNYGLDLPVSNNVQPGGVLYISAVSTDDLNAVSAGEVRVHIYGLELSSGEVDQITNAGTRHSFSAVDRVHMLALANDERIPTGDDVRPLWYDVSTNKHGIFETLAGFNEHNLVASPDNVHIAFVQQENKKSTRSAMNDLGTWRTVVHNGDTNENLVIEGGVSPQWIEDGRALLVVKEDGVYRFDLQTRTDRNVFSTYYDLDSATELAVSENSGYFVLTIPKGRLVSVGRFTNGVMEEIGTIHDERVVRHSPVFDPAGSYYALLESSLDTSDVFIDSAVAIRPVTSRQTITVYPLIDFAPDMVMLDDWQDFLFTDPLNAEEIVHSHDDSHAH